MRREPPQEYTHDVECVIHALAALGETVTSLSQFLEEQMGPEWKKQKHVLKISRRSLARAQMWIRNAMK